MITHNLFIISSPLQLMNAIEAINHFKVNNNILLILYIDGDKRSLSQIESLKDYVEWNRVKYFSLPQKGLDKVFFVREVNLTLRDIIKENIERVFVGDYQSEHINHIVNTINSKSIYLLDDGMAVTYFNRWRKRFSYQVKIRNLIYKLLGYRLNYIKYRFFTIFDIENEKVIKNNYNFFKSYLGNKEIENSVYFIGQPLVEFDVMSKADYKKELTKIIDFYIGKRVKYILHRREKIKNIKKLSLELNFEYIEFDNLIELEMINAKRVPSTFATFYSTAIVTLPSFLSELDYRVFRSQDRIFNIKFVDNIANGYKELEKMGLRIEEL